MSRLGDFVRNGATPDELRTTARDMRDAQLARHAHEGRRALTDQAVRLADFRAATTLGQQADHALAIVQALAEDLAARYEGVAREGNDGTLELVDPTFDPTRELMAAVKAAESGGNP